MQSTGKTNSRVKPSITNNHCPAPLPCFEHQHNQEDKVTESVQVDMASISD
jgi:hypothetical protein